MTGSACGGRLEFQVMENFRIGTDSGTGNGSISATGTAVGHVLTGSTE
jgi:hypothetical protein